jgi:hypothetical protein
MVKKAWVIGDEMSSKPLERPRLVVWDVDRVWYHDISTTYAARGSKADYRPYLEDFVNRGWFTNHHVALWENKMGRRLDSVGALADMLTDFLYKMKGEVYEGLSDQERKNRTIEGKQSLLRGLTIGEVKAIAGSVPYTDGLTDAVVDIRQAGIHQVGFSDGLGPFVAYKMLRQDVDVGGIVPALLNCDGEEIWFTDNNPHLLLNYNSAQLLGKVGQFKKSEAIFEYIQKKGYQISEVAAIDDSSANTVTLAKIRDGGGIGIGFRVNDMDIFRLAGIPVIRGDDLGPFGEIVKDPSKIREYCETWGIEV